MRLLAAPDKFRGTLPAREAAAARAAGAEGAGWTADERPLADGGEGTLDVLGGGNRRTLVSGPLGEPVEAAWRLEEDGTALIEAAQACGLTLAGGPERNDPLRATSRGVGELIAAAVAEGATRIVVTGEGLVDATSFTGKVVGRVLDRAQAAGIEALVVAGDVASGSRIDALSLVARYGPERALAEPAECLMELVETALAAGRNGP